MIDVDPLTVTLVAGSTTLGLVVLPPDSWTNVTVDPVRNPVPVMVTDTPPRWDPVVGLIDATVGYSCE